MPTTVHILLVDDDDVDVMAVQRAMKKARIANPLAIARDGVEALEILRGADGAEGLQAPYVILLDLNMPRMDGIAFLKELRSDPQHKRAVVFILTTSDHDIDRAAAYDEHVAGYILKSNVGSEFMDMIDLLGAYWKIVELPELAA